MEQQEKIDVFKVLEEKVEILINQIRSLRNDTEMLEKKKQENEKVIADLTGELENLREIKATTKNRIESIIHKIENLEM